MRELELTSFPLTDVALIEASAGTGKTYSIVRIYLRHVIERGRRAEQIVVATFTNAATDELRARLRDGLGEAVALVDGLGGGEVPAEWRTRDAGDTRRLLAEGIERIAAGDGDRARARRLARDRLRLAQVSVDLAPIATIDAICGRWAMEFALDSALSMHAQERSDGAAVLATAIRREVERLGALEELPFPELLTAAEGERRSDLESWLRLLLGHPEGRLAGEAPDPGALRQRLAEGRARLLDFRGAVEYRSSAPDKDKWLKATGLPKRIAKTELVADALEAIATLLAGGATERARWDETVGVLAQAEPQDWLTKDGAERVEAAFLASARELVDLCADADRLRRRRWFDALGDVADRVADAVRRAEAEQGLLTFDALTRRVRTALAADPELARQIAARYPVALIDEFQDSSPDQAAIFRLVYGAAGAAAALVMIGDPKQAIYAFRGGDVFAYLQARDAAGDRQYRLPRNYRSAAGSLAAVNRLFDDARDPFHGTAIRHAPVTPGLPWQAHPDLAEWQPLRVLLPTDGRRNLGAIASLVAAEVTALVDADRVLPFRGDGEDGRLLERRRPGPADIAVLTRTNPGASAVYRALARLGYPVVMRTTTSLFETPEAAELQRFLDGCARPTDPGLVRAALATRLAGRTERDLALLREEGPDWERELAAFALHRRTWLELGVLPLLYPLLAAAAPAWLAEPGGLRTLTNWLQLAELAQEAWETHRTIPGFLRWLRRMREDQRSRVEEGGDRHLLRLETDDRAIQVVTLHRSKGLEYPVTILADPWRAVGQRSDPQKLAAGPAPFVFHDPADGTARVDLGSAAREANAARAFAEALQEDLRLAYVGLTRARYRCAFTWSEALDWSIWRSGFHWLVCDAADRSFSGSPAVGKAKDVDGLAWLRGEAEAQPGLLELVAVDPAAPLPRWQEGAGGTAPLEAAPLAPLPADHWAVTSFSAIKGDAATDDNAIELVDLTERASREAEETLAAPVSAQAPPAFLAGAGRQYGNAFHGVMEAAMDEPPVDEETGTALALRELERFGVRDGAAVAAATWRQARLVLDLDLAEEDMTPLRLAALPRAERVVELEFDVALAPHRGAELAAILDRHGHAATAALLARRRLPLDGLLHGFIDLAFRHDGRYFVLDYKTNWLGDTLAHYAPPRLDAAMLAGSYDLQYLLYTVALDRWLAGLLPDYRRERDLGGVYYLFVRGMRPGGREGIWFRRPEPRLIAELAACMCPSGVPA